MNYHSPGFVQINRPVFLGNPACASSLRQRQQCPATAQVPKTKAAVTGIPWYLPPKKKAVAANSISRSPPPTSRQITIGLLPASFAALHAPAATRDCQNSDCQCTGHFLPQHLPVHQRCKEQTTPGQGHADAEHGQSFPNRRQNGHSPLAFPTFFCSCNRSPFHFSLCAVTGFRTGALGEAQRKKLDLISEVQRKESVCICGIFISNWAILGGRERESLPLCCSSFC